jgi:hypothetical protein
MLEHNELHQLAIRAVKFADGYSGSDESLLKMKEMITLSANELICVYDKAKYFEREAHKKLNSGENSINNFKSVISDLAPFIKTHLPDFNETAEMSSVPDDVFESISTIIDELIDLEQKPEEVSKSLIPDLELALKKAEEEWRQTESSQMAVQLSQKLLRVKAESFYHNLKLYRRTLANIIGREHSDYRKLRDSSVYKKIEVDPSEIEDKDC